MDQSQSRHHLQHQQHQQQQPQDVLAEARKNLQVLIDSGLSRDLLHQLVDDGAPLQLMMPFSNPNHQSLLQPSQQQTSLPSQPEASPSSSPLIPPAPQCAPPPVPTHVQQQQPTPPDSHQHSMLSPISSSSPVSDFIKTEAPLSEDTTGRLLLKVDANERHCADEPTYSKGPHADIDPFSLHQVFSSTRPVHQQPTARESPCLLPALLPPAMLPSGQRTLPRPTCHGRPEVQIVHECRLPSLFHHR